MSIADQNQKDWWAPVWRGLVLDKEGKHYRQMGSALWLLLYFILCADRRTGTLKRKIPTVSLEMGVRPRTLREWLSILRQAGYIYTQNDGRCLLIGLRKWKSFPQRHSFHHQNGAKETLRMAEDCHLDGSKDSPEALHPSQETPLALEADDNTIKKDIYKNNVTENVLSNRFSSTGAGQRESEKILAWEVCQALQDQANLPLYISYVRKYPLKIIRRAFQAAINTPEEKIKKTRGALFNYLVKYYANKQDISENPGHQSGMEIPGDSDFQ